MTHTPRLHRVRDQQALADAKTRRLNNAAPDMLEVLGNVYFGCWIDRDSYVQRKITMEEYEAMRIAIKKARGKE